MKKQKRQKIKEIVGIIKCYSDGLVDYYDPFHKEWIKNSSGVPFNVWNTYSLSNKKFIGRFFIKRIKEKGF